MSFYEEIKNAHTQYKNASTVYFSDTVIKQAEHGLILTWKQSYFENNKMIYVR